MAPDSVYSGINSIIYDSYTSWPGRRIILVICCSWILPEESINVDYLFWSPSGISKATYLVIGYVHNAACWNIRPTRLVLFNIPLLDGHLISKRRLTSFLRGPQFPFCNKIYQSLLGFFLEKYCSLYRYFVLYELIIPLGRARNAYTCTMTIITSLIYPQC